MSTNLMNSEFDLQNGLKSIRPQTNVKKRDSRQGFEGQLPYSTSAKTYKVPTDQLIPSYTRDKSSHLHAKNANHEPFYNRYWTQFPNDIPPVFGNPENDPRYSSIQTNLLKQDYK